MSRAGPHPRRPCHTPSTRARHLTADASVSASGPTPQDGVADLRDIDDSRPQSPEGGGEGGGGTGEPPALADSMCSVSSEVDEEVAGLTRQLAELDLQTHILSDLINQIKARQPPAQQQLGASVSSLAESEDGGYVPFTPPST